MLTIKTRALAGCTLGDGIQASHQPLTPVSPHFIRSSADAE